MYIAGLKIMKNIEHVSITNLGKTSLNTKTKTLFLKFLYVCIVLPWASIQHQNLHILISYKELHKLQVFIKDSLSKVDILIIHAWIPSLINSISSNLPYEKK